MSDIAASEVLEQMKAANGEAKKYRIKLRAERQAAAAKDARIKELEDVLIATGTERDEFEKRLSSAPSEHLAEIDRLRGELRVRDHRDVFSRLARAAKVREDAIQDAWELAKIKADSDTPDEAQITQTIEQLLASRAYLKAEAQGAGDPAKAGAGAPKPSPGPGPGLGRGSVDPSAGGLVVRMDQISNTEYMRRNQAAIAAASKAGTLTILPSV